MHSHDVKCVMGKSRCNRIPHPLFFHDQKQLKYNYKFQVWPLRLNYCQQVLSCRTGLKQGRPQPNSLKCRGGGGVRTKGLSHDMKPGSGAKMRRHSFVDYSRLKRHRGWHQKNIWSVGFVEENRNPIRWYDFSSSAKSVISPPLLSYSCKIVRFQYFGKKGCLKIKRKEGPQWIRIQLCFSKTNVTKNTKFCQISTEKNTTKEKIAGEALVARMFFLKKCRYEHHFWGLGVNISRLDNLWTRYKIHLNENTACSTVQ